MTDKNKTGCSMDKNIENKSNSIILYIPVIVVFATSAVLALSLRLGFMEFMAFSFAFLASLKLMDIKTFVISFVEYDLISKKHRVYAYAYPFIELGLAVCLLSGVFLKISGLISLIVGSFGAYSIIKTVYIEKRKLKCACVGGGKSVPLGTISIIENLMMVIMGLILVFS